MHIRKANIEDCDIFVRLRIEMGLELDKSFNEYNLNDLIKRTQAYFIDNISNGSFIAFLAFEDNQGVAMGGISLYSVAPYTGNPRGKVAYLMSMYTIPMYRKKGIATQLIDLLVTEAKSLECDQITLNASSMGRSVYQKYGFEDNQNAMVYYPR